MAKQASNETGAPAGPFPSAYHAVGAHDADVMLAKAQIVKAIMSEVESRGLTQAAAAELLGLQRSNLSRLFSGEFKNVTFDKLFQYLGRLGLSVRVTFGPEQAQGVTVERDDT